MRIVSLCMTILVGSLALMFSMFALGNITDYGTNWTLVRHVLSMDTIFPDSTLHWRAITDPALQTAIYWLIIAWEALTAVVLWIGAVRMVAASTPSSFARAKTTAVVGVTPGMILFLVVFVHRRRVVWHVAIHRMERREPGVSLRIDNGHRSHRPADPGIGSDH